MLKKYLFVVLMTSLTACTCKSDKDTLVLFVEQEDGVEPYQTRMIITRDFVRIDDGAGDKDFVLFDRRNKVVHSVNSSVETIMTVYEKKLKAGEKFEPPFQLNHSSKQMPGLKDAPTINREKARQYQLITNNEVCYNVIAVKRLMPNVVTALKEFHKHMATDSYITFKNLPADMHDACDMSMTTFLPGRQFEFGFPIREWGKRNYSRSLVDYNVDYKAEPSLFKLPAGYKRYSVSELREGKVNFSQ